MNNLRYIPRISVPRHASPGAALLSRQHADMYLEKRTFRSQTVDSTFANRSRALGVEYSKQFRRNPRLVSKECKAMHKQRIRRFSVTSLKKQSLVNRKLSQNIVKAACHYSTCQNIKSDGSGITKRHTFQSSIINGTNTINRRNSIVASASKHHRSYAEMIADYSEMLNTISKSTVNTRSDSLYFNNGIRKSPFSTVSAPKMSRVAERSEISDKELDDDSFLPTDARQLLDFRPRDTNKNTDQERVATKSDDQSYAKLVANCSKYMHITSVSNVTNSGLIPKSNVLSKSSRKPFATPTRNASSTNVQETSSAVSKAAVTGTGGETDDYWTREIQSVTNDLNVAIRRKAAKAGNFHKVKENDTPEPEFAKLQDRIDKLIEIIEARKEKERDTTVDEANSQNRTSSRGDKTSDLPSYLSKTATISPARGTSAASSYAAKKNFAQMPSGGNTDVSTQPQVKLRMVPSEKESVVSINVDSASGLSDPLDPLSKQLSVVVQSDQKGDPQSAGNQWSAPAHLQSAKSTSQRGDFGPMRISISEDSAPIKQIEFSINGKPVSELKSVTARTEKLDVVSSMDKIEIRIPFAKDDAPSNIRGGVSAKETDPGGGQILNVQISANFQNEFTKSRVGQTTEEINTTPLSTAKTNYVFDTSADTTNPSSIKEKKTFKDGKAETKTVMNTVRSPNKDSKIESSDDSRFPSKMIPWWSSSDSFKKMKKIDEDLSSKKKKFPLNLKTSQNPITKPGKSEETSKSSMSKCQSMNNATITNSSSNLISYSRSTKHLVDSEPVYHYSSSFRVKSDQENSTIHPNSGKHVLQTGDNLVTKKDNKKKFEIKQTESITLCPDTNRRISVKKKKLILQKKYKVPSSAKNFLLPENREKKRQHLLEQTLSIEDVPNTRTEIKNIKNTMKSAKIRQDNTWIDFGLKSRTNSTERLNNEKLMSIRSVEEKKMRKTSQMEQNVTGMTSVKTQNNIITNTPHVRKDAATNSPNLRSFPNVTQATKQEKLAINTTVPRDKFKQTLKALSELSKINSSSNIETSSEAIIRNSVKSHNKITSADVSSSRTNSNSILNIKPKRTMTEISTSVNKSNKKIDMKDTTAKDFVSRNSKSRNLLSKSEKHSLCLSKSEKNRENVLVSFPRKPTPADLSTRSKIQMESTVTSRDNCIYMRKLPFTELLYPSFDKDNTLLDSQPVMFNFPQNLENVRNISDHNAPNVVTGSCADRPDRPEKHILYSAWLHQLKKDVEQE